jgi:hypothetical protein
MIIPGSIVAKNLADSSMSPLWKVSLVTGSIVLGGFVYIMFMHTIFLKNR